jgi:hypothetical protein
MALVLRDGVNKVDKVKKKYKVLRLDKEEVVTKTMLFACYNRMRVEKEVRKVCQGWKRVEK